MNFHPSKLFVGALFLGASVLIHAPRSHAAELNEPPSGFTAVFNGKDLTGFRGGSTFDPRKLAAMSEEDRTAQIAKWTETMRAHWRVEEGELINDGKGD